MKNENKRVKQHNKPKKKLIKSKKKQGNQNQNNEEGFML